MLYADHEFDGEVVTRAEEVELIVGTTGVALDLSVHGQRTPKLADKLSTG